MTPLSAKLPNPRLYDISHSSRATLHSCPRKYELSKYEATYVRDSTVHTAFGSALGAGIQALICGKSLTQATWIASCNWEHPDLLDEEPKSKKSFFTVMSALAEFEHKELPEIKEDWEVYYLPDGQPAAELSILFAFTKLRYRGKVDLVLQHKVTKELATIELKTTGSYTTNEAEYKNSPQGIGYALAVDVIAQSQALGSNFNVVYLVYRTRSQVWDTYLFPKTKADKLEFIQNLLLDEKAIEQYSELPLFPRSGKCLTYGRVCNYYNVCHMATDVLTSSEVPKAEAPDAWKYKFSLAELTKVLS